MSRSTTFAFARLAVAALVGLGALAAAPSAGAQEPAPTTTNPVLVPGETTPTTRAPSGGTPAPTSTTEADDGGGLLDLDLDANEKVWIIVGGLVVIAVVMAVLTVVYWRHTRPDRSGEPEAKETRAERRARKREAKAAARDPFVEDEAVGEEPEPVEGPLDLDALLGGPEPSRSVFGDVAEGPGDDEERRR